MISKRLKEITSFIVMDVLEKAHEMERKGVNIVHLEVGEPDFDTPSCVKAAACRALDEGHTHYTHSLGLFELREAICEYYASTYGVSIDPDQSVRVTADALPDVTMTGTILSVSDFPRDVRGDVTYVARIRLDSTDPRLRWGMTVLVEFQ